MRQTATHDHPVQPLRRDAEKKNKDLCYQLPTLISSWFEPVFVAMAMQDTSILEYLASWIVLDTWRAAEQ
jgi:hypothetical protein